MEDVDEFRVEHETGLQILVEVDRICRERGLTYYLAYGTALGAVRHRGFIPWDGDVDIMVCTNSYAEFCSAVSRGLSDRFVLESRRNDPAYEELFARIALKGVPHQSLHVDVFPMAGAPRSLPAQRVFSKIAYLTYRSYFVKKVDVSVNYKDRPRRRRQAIFAKVLLLPVPSSLLVRVFEALSDAFPVETADNLCNICGSYGFRELMPKSFLGDPVYLEFEGYEFPLPSRWDEYLAHVYGDYLTPKRASRHG